jgi:hypothetical protein
VAFSPCSNHFSPPVTTKLVAKEGRKSETSQFVTAGATLDRGLLSITALFGSRLGVLPLKPVVKGS